MIDESQQTPRGIEDELRPEVAVFKEDIAKADGTLLPLRKTTLDGKKLYVAARFLKRPWNLDDADVNPRFYGWEEDRGKMMMTGVMLVDAYAEEEGKITPLGHMDWWIQNDYANGGGNMHDAPKPKTEHEKLASQRWHKHDYTAFKVDYNYHKQGIGSLMVAASAIALPNIGIKKFYTGGLLEPAAKTYERFGIKDEDFPWKPVDRSLPIERLSQHPQVSKTISEFV